MNSVDAEPLSVAQLIAQLAGGTLQDAATGVKLATVTLGIPFTAGVPGVTFEAGVGTTFTVFAYGGGRAVDPEGVVGVPVGKAGAMDALQVPPPLMPEARVYLTYRLDAIARAGGGR